MKKKFYLLLALSFGFGRVYSTTHTILFGGATGNKYSPDSLEVLVGDLIHWEGSFASHPLVSTGLPFGAKDIDVSTGTIFEYTIEKPGDYRFKCSVHGFMGVLKATDPAAGLGSIAATVLKTHFDFESKQFFIQNDISNAVCIQILDGAGKLIESKALTFFTSMQLDLSFLQPGFYVIAITSENRKLKTEKIYR